MAMLRQVAKYQPAECQVSQDTTSYLQALHVDYEEDGTPTLYDVAATSIIELRGDESMLEMNHKFMNLLLWNAVEEVSDDTLLGLLYKEFVGLCSNKKFKFKRMFLHYLESLFEDPVQLLRIQNDIINSFNLNPHDDYDMDSIKLKLNEDFAELKILLPITVFHVP
jgi:hypothetical protein